MTREKVVEDSSVRETKVGDAARVLPMWREVSNYIDNLIKTRALVPGDKLPTEQELALKFMVTRHTVRRALAHLSERGLVESTQGRGSFVRRPAIAYKVGRRTRWSEMMHALRAMASTKTLVADVRPAEVKVARSLKIAIGAPVVLIERLGLADGEPVSLSRHYFSEERFPYFIDMYRKSLSITQTLLQSGVPDYIRSRTRVSARSATVEECELLHLPRHVPVLVTQSLNLDGLRDPLEWGEARFAADRIELDLDMDMADTD